MDPPNWSRRRAISTLGAAVLFGSAGCSSLGENAQTTTTPSSSTSTSRRSTTRTRNTTRYTETTTPETTTTKGTQNESTSTTETTTNIHQQPGYIDNHWHGRLSLGINGRLVNFYQPKYFLKNIEKAHPETVHFHFHKTQHGPNEWSNEKKVVTLAEALNLIPDITYKKSHGSNVLAVNGRTFHGGQGGTSIKIYRDTEPVDPPTYHVNNQDHFWIDIRTKPRSPSQTPRTGTFILDLNNRRARFNTGTYVSSSNSQVSIDKLRKPGRHRWTSKGEPVTLGEFLSAIPRLDYAKKRGNDTLTYSGGSTYSGTYNNESSKTTILFRQRMHDVDPASYTLRNGDIIWVYVHTKRLPDNTNSFITTHA